MFILFVIRNRFLRTAELFKLSITVLKLNVKPSVVFHQISKHKHFCLVLKYPELFILYFINLILPFNLSLENMLLTQQVQNQEQHLTSSHPSFSLRFNLTGLA